MAKAVAQPGTLVCDATRRSGIEAQARSPRIRPTGPRRWQSVAEAMAVLGHRAREAARELALASTEGQERRADGGGARDARADGRHPRRQRPRPGGRRRRVAPRAAFLDRLTLDPKRVEAMAKGLEEIAALPDPVGSVIAALDAAERARDRARARAARRDRHHLREPAERDGRCRRAVPQGRQRRDPARRLGEPPLEPGHPGLPGARPAPRRACPRPPSSWCRPPTARPSALMLKGLDGAIDVIVPRGGKSLVARVQEEARVPVFAHLEGICHTYVDRSADLAMAKAHRRQRQDAAHGRVRRHRDAAGRRQGARRPPVGADRGADRGRLRGARRRGGAEGRRCASSRPPSRTGRPNISTPSSR